MALQQKSLRDYLSQHSCYFIKKLILSFYFDFVVFIFWEIVNFFLFFFLSRDQMPKFVRRYINPAD
jgi:hypothetical protein